MNAAEQTAQSVNPQPFMARKSQKEEEREDIIAYIVQHRRVHGVPSDVESTELAIDDACEVFDIELSVRQKKNIVRTICD